MVYSSKRGIDWPLQWTSHSPEKKVGFHPDGLTNVFQVTKLLFDVSTQPNSQFDLAGLEISWGGKRNTQQNCVITPSKFVFHPTKCSICRLKYKKKDTSFPGTERDGVVASGGVGMTLVSKIVCHWQRQNKTTKMLSKVGVILVPVILGITLISKNSSCIVIIFLHMTFILQNKKPTTTNDNNKALKQRKA